MVQLTLFPENGMFNATVFKEWYVCLHCLQEIVCLTLLFLGNGLFDATVSKEWYV